MDLTGRGQNGSPGDDPTAASHPRAHEHLVGRFAAWLEETLAEEDPPEGLAREILEEVEGAVDLERIAAPGRQSDFGALWSVVTSLCQEVKLQGRAFKELSDKASSGELGSRMDELLRAQAGFAEVLGQLAEETRAGRREEAKELIAEGERRAQRETLDLLLDLRERLQRGLAVATDVAPAPRAAPAPRPPGLLARFLRRERPARGEEPQRQPEPQPEPQALAAIRKGYSMTLERLEEALGRLGVEEIACRGKPFDPHVMTAVEVVRTDSVPEGVVVDVFRSGYRWRGDLLRTARVRVAAPRNGGRESGGNKRGFPEESS